MDICISILIFIYIGKVSCAGASNRSCTGTCLWY